MRKSILSSVVVLVLALMSAPHVAAQSSGKKSKADSGHKTKKAPSMSEAVYNKLTEAQELIETNRTNEGLAMLGEIKNMKKLSPYEKAQLYNYYAYTYFTLERYRDAIRSYETVLAQPDLPEALETGTLYTLAQLYFTEEEYRKAITYINRWFTVAPKPTETAYLLLGQAYYQLEEYRKSLQPIKQAMAMVKARGQVPKENLYLLMRVNYYELDDYKNMAAVIIEMIPHYPKTQYWLTLAGAYSEMKKLDKQMSIMEMLYEAGDLIKGNQRLNLANLYLLHEAPFKAAKILETGMKDKVIKAEIRNLRLLSQAWMQAKEHRKSIAPLKRAASKSNDGELYIRLGQSYVNLDRWKDAVGALRSGLKKGKVKRRDQANIMLGLALFEQKKFESAKRAFVNARKDKRSRRAANQWIAYVDSEIARRNALEEGMKMRVRAQNRPPA